MARTEPKWKVEVSFHGEAPKDGNRILRDVKKLLSYDKCHGKIGSYWYSLQKEVTEDVYEWIVQHKPTRRELKKKQEFRHIYIRAIFLNRVWRIVTTPSGFPVYLCEAV